MESLKICLAVFGWSTLESDWMCASVGHEVMKSLFKKPEEMKSSKEGMRPRSKALEAVQDEEAREVDKEA